MQIKKDLHLSYCSNIHQGEDWNSIYDNLQKYIPSIKAKLSVDQPFGIGLRLSDLASKEILENEKLAIFKKWLKENDCYVFTMNGFPFGNFHQHRVKDYVHLPDWTTEERLAYTLRLFDILAELLPQHQEGGISTSPLSYKLWWKTEAEKKSVLEKSTENLIIVAQYLAKIRKKTGKILHLDIEPEPDGLLENTRETLDYFNNYLLEKGVNILAKNLRINKLKAKEVILTHIQLCYDVCHFAVEYENHSEALQEFEKQGIRIGKFQISAALKADLPPNEKKRKAIFDEFAVFDEPIYLHQVIAKNNMGNLFNFNDLPLALAQAQGEDFVEWRTHFHVPIFLKKYNRLQSTQEDIIKILKILKEKPHLSKHLEVETYTWAVLPADIQTNMAEAIQRELEWVIANF